MIEVEIFCLCAQDRKVFAKYVITVHGMVSGKNHLSDIDITHMSIMQSEVQDFLNSLYTSVGVVKVNALEDWLGEAKEKYPEEFL